MNDKKPSQSDKDQNCDGKKVKDMIIIPDDFEGYSLDSFSIPKHYEDYFDRVVIPYGLIQDRIEKMSIDFVRTCKEGEKYTALCVLKGGFRFLSDLTDRITSIIRRNGSAIPIHVDFIRLKSYEDDSSTGKVQIIGGDNLQSLEGQNVIVVEDIVDTGRTMIKLLNLLKEYKPKTIQVFSLILKRTPFSNGYIPDYTGFEVPDHFIVGYALDFNEHFRDMNHICIINEKGKKKFSNQITDSDVEQTNGQIDIS